MLPFACDWSSCGTMKKKGAVEGGVVDLHMGRSAKKAWWMMIFTFESHQKTASPFPVIVPTWTAADEEDRPRET